MANAQACWFWLVIGTLLFASDCRAADILLHSFGNQGSALYDSPSSLILEGTTFYGTTMGSVPANHGTLFQIHSDGTGFGLLHTFAGGANDAAAPEGELMFSDGMLFGMSDQGGSENNCGTIYRLKTDGSSFTLLHRFLDGHLPVEQDGDSPNGGLIQIEGKLYGMAPSGGGKGDPNGNGKGVIFCVNKDGSDFTILHAFAGGEKDGAAPTGSLLRIDSVLYGAAQNGGKADQGVLFQIDPNGSNFKILHSFGLHGNLGCNPLGSLSTSGKTLCGSTWLGGKLSHGAPFTFQLSSNVLTTFDAFDAAEEKPESPGELTVSGKWVYGFARRGGQFGRGCIFRSRLDGDDFKVLHSFAGAPNDGDQPCSPVKICGSALFGLTYMGGKNDRGTFYSIPLKSD